MGMLWRALKLEGWGGRRPSWPPSSLPRLESTYVLMTTYSEDFMPGILFLGTRNPRPHLQAAHSRTTRGAFSALLKSWECNLH